VKLNIKIVVYEDKRIVSVDYIYQKCSVNPKKGWWVCTQ